jgi:hypothetical protein
MTCLETTSAVTARIKAVLGCIVIVIAALMAVFVVRQQPAQLPPNDEVFRTVDALFTAITAHDERRIADCGKRLQGFEASGAIPKRASVQLERVIEITHAGDYQSAAKRLYYFMEGQKRQPVAAR